jgi:hypothetical protein
MPVLCREYPKRSQLTVALTGRRSPLQLSRLAYSSGAAQLLGSDRTARLLLAKRKKPYLTFPFSLKTTLSHQENLLNC